ncbi:MAG: large conductance mechanosensitive channel protein MscL [Gemmatimonadetes bacterium]|nr:large conductance mechanosensitive channel protein MscL [Gemmatimonadota bacterium]
MLKEFREFAVRGNMLDMAVGIVLGAAFGAIVTSLVKDVMMPPIGFLLGGVDFSDKFILLRAGDPGASYTTLAAAQEAGAVTLNWGVFLNAIISFLIIAFAVFMVVKSYNRLKQSMEAEKAAAPPEPPKQEVLLGEIRDLLKQRA